MHVLRCRMQQNRLICIWHYTSVTIRFVWMACDDGYNIIRLTDMTLYQCGRQFCMHGLLCRIQHNRINRCMWHYTTVTVCSVCIVHDVQYSIKRLIYIWHYTNVSISFVSMFHDEGHKKPTYLWQYQCDCMVHDEGYSIKDLTDVWHYTCVTIILYA